MRAAPSYRPTSSHLAPEGGTAGKCLIGKGLHGIRPTVPRAARARTRTQARGVRTPPHAPAYVCVRAQVPWDGRTVGREREGRKVKIGIGVKGLDEAITGITTTFDAAAVNETTAKALNDVAFRARQAEQEGLRAAFDRVTPFIVKSLYVEPATAGKLVAKLWPKDYGGKGVDPANVLRHHIEGGGRTLKASESILRRAGILPGGFFLAPGAGAPLDAYGNIPGSFMVRLLSYLQTFYLAGSTLNMSDKRKRRLAKGGRTDAGFKRIGGVEYFAVRRGESTHLKPGIYSRSGIHGADVMPILAFVRKPSYSVRFPFYGIAGEVAARELEPALVARFRAALKRAGGKA